MDLIRRPGISTVGAIGATPNASGASVAGSTLTLQPADASFGGVITTDTQILAGAKTWLSPVRSKPTGLAGLQLDCNAATGDFTLSLSPANLSANRRWTLPNRDDTFAGLGAQTFTGAQRMSSSLDVHSSVLTGQATGQIACQYIAIPDGSLSVGGANYSRFISYFTGTDFFFGTDAAGTGTVRGLQFSSGTGQTNFTNTTDATSTTAAALVVAGGVGIAKKLRVGQDVIIGTDPGGSELLRVGGGARVNGQIAIIVGDGTRAASISGVSGKLSISPYLDAVNGARLESLNLGETVNLPMTLVGSNVQLIGGSGTGLNVTATGAVIIGTDPGGSQLLRIGGSVRADNFYVKNAQAFRGYNAAVSTDYRLIGITASDVVNIDGDGRGAFFGATDPGGTDALRVGGALTVNSAVMIQTKTAFTNGAAAAAGTLLNAPVAGNPTKWIPINDNGTTRYLPAW